MYAVFNCIAYEHDLRLVVLAAVICALASFTAISLLHHVRRSGAHMRRVWLAVSAISTGFGVWATHFIAMLAFSPGVPTAYNIALTGLSLVAAILLTGAGLAVAVSIAGAGAWLGGAMVGGGIAAMHYTGMAAFEIPGRIVWNPILVAASIALGGLIGAAALPVGLREDNVKWKILGALLLTAAICSHHVTAMGAAKIVLDPAIELSGTALPPGLLAIAVAFASFVIVGLALGGVAIEMRARRRELETGLMRGAANSIFEGLLVCEGATIVTVNDNFAALIGCSADSVVGTKLEQFFADADILTFFDHPNQSIEGNLVHFDGSKIPVELIQRSIDFGGKPHRAIAVRDLRARKDAEKHIRFLAHYDALTGLSNRVSFNKKLDQEIEAALAMGRRLAILSFVLDQFKHPHDLFNF